MEPIDMATPNRSSLLGGQTSTIGGCGETAVPCILAPVAGAAGVKDDEFPGGFFE